MTHIVDSVTAYDRKRMKVTLDSGDVTFLLYKGEMKASGIAVPTGEERAGQEISGEDLSRIFSEILLPRAKKRCLYYLKNGDKTEFQIRRKLTEGFYPEEVIEGAMEFLRHYRFADDRRYAENLLESFRGSRSKREIAAKLFEKGIPKEVSEEVLSGISEEDEYLAAEKALRKKCTGDRKKDCAYLCRKGFSYDACEHALCELGACYEIESDEGEM